MEPDLFIPDEKFYCQQYITYPPFKHGYYLEEYFLDYMQRTNRSKDRDGRTYIPAFWTAMQIEGWFPEEKPRLQAILNKYIEEHPNTEAGYFTIVQHDDGVLLDLPANTVLYGACTGNTILPLIYQDTNNTLVSKSRPSYEDKTILCSFIGSYTHELRKKCYDVLCEKPGFKFHLSHNWTSSVQNDAQELFIQTTLNSKFALAPRGYGRSSFRFFEIFQLGCIPVYVWDDVEWLPYTELLDYSKFCISIHENQIDELDTILSKIDETKYQEMWKEYEKIKQICDRSLLFLTIYS